MDASCCIQRNIHVLNSIQINVCPEYWVHIKIGDFMKGSTMKTYKVLTINPGSTSTKIALFENETCLYSKNVAHDASELAKYNKISDQLPYRRNMILDLVFLLFRFAFMSITRNMIKNITSINITSISIISAYQEFII